MRRWHSSAERRIMLRRWRQEIATHERTVYRYNGNRYAAIEKRYPFWGALAPLPPDPEGDCHCYRGMGYFRKRAPLDCGKPRCATCHYEKFWEPKRRANVKRKAIRQSLDEL